MNQDQQPEQITFVGTEYANRRIDQLQQTVTQWRTRAEDDETATPERLRLVIRTLRAQCRTNNKEIRELRVLNRATSKRLGEVQLELDKIKQQHTDVINEVSYVVMHLHGGWMPVHEAVTRLTRLAIGDTEPATDEEDTTVTSFTRLLKDPRIKVIATEINGMLHEVIGETLGRNEVSELAGRILLALDAEPENDS